MDQRGVHGAHGCSLLSQGEAGRLGAGGAELTSTEQDACFIAPKLIFAKFRKTVLFRELRKAMLCDIFLKNSYFSNY